MSHSDTDLPPFGDDDYTGRALWQARVEKRLQNVEEVAAALRTIRVMLGFLLAGGMALAGWSVRTTLVTETRVESMERSVSTLERMGADMAEIKTEIRYLRRDVERGSP